MKKISVLIESFFTERLVNQQKVSENTIMSYRDTFKILLKFMSQKRSKAPSDLELCDFDSELIGEFLTYLEKERKNAVRSRNVRLAAIHSFFKYVSFEEPRCLERIRRILSIPQKKMDKREVTSLSEKEMEEILLMPNRSTIIGRRDHAMLVLALDTGLRVSELVSLNIEHLKIEKKAYIYCIGKGRKERTIPLTSQTAKILIEWLKENIGCPSDPLFPSQRGERLSRDGVEKLLKKYTLKAQKKCPSLKCKKITPHVLRHTTAMRLLRADVDTSVIALYLGHESLETTNIYLKADLEIKEKVLLKMQPTKNKFKRYQPDDKLLAYLSGL